MRRSTYDRSFGKKHAICCRCDEPLHFEPERMYADYEGSWVHSWGEEQCRHPTGWGNMATVGWEEDYQLITV